MYGYVCIYIYIYIHVWYMYACVFTYKIQQLEREDRNISGYLIWCGSTRIYRQSLSPVITGDHEVLGIQISVDLGTTIMVDMAGAWCWLRLRWGQIHAHDNKEPTSNTASRRLDHTWSYWIACFKLQVPPTGAVKVTLLQTWKTNAGRQPPNFALLLTMLIYAARCTLARWNQHTSMSHLEVSKVMGVPPNHPT